MFMRKTVRFVFLTVLALCFAATFADASGLTCPEATHSQAVVQYNSSKTFQTIEGIGGFGFRNVNWAEPSTWWTDAWGDLVINDLGFTITRNEWYPPSIEGEVQDTNWTVQKPYIEKIHDFAKVSGKPLKQIISIWSPPAYMKENHSTKNGGKLLPEYYTDFGRWLVECIDSYKSVGVDVYALSFQNEPAAVVPYNSCYYAPEDYPKMIKVVGPIVKNAHPNVKLMGPEEQTCQTWNWDSSYGKALLDDQEALKWIDIIAVHPYTVEYVYGPPDPIIEAMQLKQVYEKYKVAGKQIWVSECCGWNDNWLGGMLIAESIHNSFYYGNITAWVHWVISGDETQAWTGLTYYGEQKEKYYAVRHFSRYIRPGAVRIEASSTNPDLLVTAFRHQNEKSLTLVLINRSSNPMNLSLEGDLKTYLTMESSTIDEKAVQKGRVSSFRSNLTLPSKSITTLYGSI
ncbi:MAG TPA: glycoside hydrolase family 30 beta sandwich domain-containing protein [Bacillota bacterium]|nr:glycoside hydrolase family 30 beta sandwich domain-containing protein [Bacillota bacterium]